MRKRTKLKNNSIMELNDIKFKKTNGGLGRQGASEDPIGGLLMYLPAFPVTTLINVANAKIWDIVTMDSGDALYVAKFLYPEELADCGISRQAMDTDTLTAITSVSDSKIKERSSINALYYHVTEFFRMNPNGTLYVGIPFGEATNVNVEQIETLQTYANGSIRQLGIFASGTGNLGDYQTEATALEKGHRPLSMVVAVPGKTCAFAANSSSKWVPTYTAVSALTLSKLASTTASDAFVASGRCNLSMVAGCDLDGDVVEMLGHYAYCGFLGTVLGAVSRAAVNESIAWVGKFPLGLKKPGFISGELLTSVSVANLEKINGNRYIFPRCFSGSAECYCNDSFTLDVPTSDYGYIENERTIDKACRGVFNNLLPWLNSPIRVDAESGKMDSGFCSFLETAAGAALEDMEKSGELSGYKAEVDPDQNVLATSMVEVVVRSVPTGAMRKVNVKIGFTTSI